MILAACYGLGTFSLTKDYHNEDDNEAILVKKQRLHKLMQREHVTEEIGRRIASTGTHILGMKCYNGRHYDINNMLLTIKKTILQQYHACKQQTVIIINKQAYLIRNKYLNILQ